MYTWWKYGWLAGLLILASGWPALAASQTGAVTLEFPPARTTIQFSLDATFHTVHGTFALRRGMIHFDPASGALTGELVADAASGQSGNDGRDRKMHKDILESDRYPEIVFRPDRVEGKVDPQGTSTVQVHGMFGLHGSEHEITIPVQVEMAPDRWIATARFVIPYIKWGLKSPNTFVLKVSQTVEIEVHAEGGK